MKDKPEIIAYVTNNKERIISGDPLCFFMEDEDERVQFVSEISRALCANAIRLKNGDYIIVADAK
jgi:hypothetical protein